MWETIYEIGHTMPMPRIHFAAARGIRSSDPSARLIGPATWPGWTVEERFVKPYLTTYGPDLLRLRQRPLVRRQRARAVGRSGVEGAQGSGDHERQPVPGLPDGDRSEVRRLVPQSPSAAGRPEAQPSGQTHRRRVQRVRRSGGIAVHGEPAQPRLARLPR